MKRFKRIYIEITNTCNLSCSFCPQTKRTKQFMSLVQFQRIIQEAAMYTNYVYLHVKGEPLLHPDLETILALCQQYNLQVNITTNGTMLKERLNILLKASALRQLNISLHSFEAGKQQVSSFENYMDQIIFASKEVQKSSNAIIALRLWNLDKDNISQSLVLQNQYVLNRLEQEFQLEDSIADYFLKNSQASKDKRNLIPRGIKLSERVYLNQSYEFLWPSLDAPNFGESGFCYGLKDQLAILSDGTVIPCCLDGEGIVALGNINHNTLTEILSSERAESIKNGFAQRTVVEELCKHCGYRERFGN